MYKALASSTVAPFNIAIESYSAGFCRIFLQGAKEHVADHKVAKALDETFPVWGKRDRIACEKENTEAVKESKELLSDLIHCSARPTPKFLQQLAHDTRKDSIHGWQRFAEVVLLAVESATNPLVPGMSLSVALADAAERAREGEKRRLDDLRRNLDYFMMVMFERLPHTVRGFKDGVRGCSRLLGPEESRRKPIGRPGPLAMSFRRKQQMENICAVPLVKDYLFNRFTCGLPDLRDTDGVLRNKEELRQLALASDDSISPSLCIGDPKIWGWSHGFPLGEGSQALTVLPGAQFTIIGLLVVPSRYYRVPAMRMAMDFVVYLLILVAFFNWILLHEDGPMTLEETLFAFYIVAGLYNEFDELVRNFRTYVQDQWNSLDLLGLLILLGGVITRLVDSDNPWGKIMYALSAPPFFSRVLFFAQMLQFQGPMIQAMFSMAEVLMQFGVVLLVVLMGFATSFFALFRDIDSFGETLLYLFRATLGDVALFDELDDSSRERYAAGGYLLVVIFVVVVTIMMLNLLIAILTTKHTDVMTEIDFKVSKARTMEHYRLVVELDILPAPFNLVQALVSLPFFTTEGQQSESYRRVKRSLGQAIFWFALGPIAIVGGMLLWIFSIPHVVPLLRHKQVNPPFRYWLPNFCFSLTLVLGVPIFLVAMWMKEPFMWIMRVYEFLCKGSRSVIDQEDEQDVDVQRLLEETGVSASKLRKYLDNPIIDPDVQRDEVNRGTTVEHMKLLRDHLKEAIKAHSENTERIVSELRNEMKETFSNTDRMVSDLRGEITNQIDQKMSRILEVLEANRISGLKEGEAT